LWNSGIKILDFLYPGRPIYFKKTFPLFAGPFCQLIDAKMDVLRTKRGPMFRKMSF
jgi:hypothetical protein